jgi:cytochrome c556
MMRLSMYSWIAAGIVAQLACAEAAAPAAAPAPTATSADPSQPALTIQELMDARIDPSADVLWDSVAFIASAKGEEDRRPRTPAEWDTVRQSALALIASVNDLSMPGRRVASIDKEPGPGELRASEIQRRIDANPHAFVRHARVLESAAKKALTAIDAKDADALMSAGGLIDEACEACHLIYWYPHQAQSRR